MTRVRLNQIDFERGWRRDGEELFVGGVGANPVEEGADLELPALQVGAEHGDLLVVAELAAAERLDLLPHPQLAGASGPEVADPLALTARRDQVAPTVELEQVDRDGAPLAARAPLDGEHA